MNTAKLKECLAEMEAQRNILDAAIPSMRNLIATLEGAPQGITASRPNVSDQAGTRSYIDESVEVLRAHGAPMHIKEIGTKVAELRGTAIPRASLESSIVRHIAKANRPRLARVGRSTFGLPEWKQPTVVQMAG